MKQLYQNQNVLIKLFHNQKFYSHPCKFIQIKIQNKVFRIKFIHLN